MSSKSSLNTIQRASEIGQAVWLDSISRTLIDSGELSRLVQSGLCGVTSNPTIFDGAIAKSNVYDDRLVEYARDGADAKTVFERLAVDDIRDAADILRPVYDELSGRDGFISIEVSPELAYDAAGTVDEARRLWKVIDRPNILIKVPGTPECIPAIRQLIGEGISVNVTLLFSLDAYRDAAEAYIDGLNDFIKAGRGATARVASVASFFVSRVDSAVDAALPDSHPAAGKIGIANAKLAYAEYQGIFDRKLGGAGRFFPLHTTGAQVQRPLWASTSVKNPSYPDTLYFDNLLGPETVNTLPEDTLKAVLDHGAHEPQLTSGLDEAQADMKALAEAGVSMNAITDQLLAEGVRKFADSYSSLLKRIETKLAALAGSAPGN